MQNPLRTLLYELFVAPFLRLLQRAADALPWSGSGD